MKSLNIQKRWGFDHQFDVLIGMNGSELYDNIHQKEYSNIKLKTEWTKEIIDLMSHFECNLMIYYENVVYCHKIDEMRLKSVASSLKKTAIVPIEKFYEVENAKIMFRMSKEELIREETYVNKHPHPDYVGFKT